MRRPTAILLTALLGLALAPVPAGHASCAAPTLEVAGRDNPADARPPALRRGQEVTVTGRFFVDGCDDTGGGSTLGCSGGEGPEETVTPLRRLPLVLGRHREPIRKLPLGARDASADGTVTWTFVVPEGFPPGPAVLIAPGATPLPVRVAG